jgi:L-lactate dehydrogenase complex protein LldE
VRVALFVPCFVDQFYPQVAVAALSILERLGVEVDVPAGAVCCGQPPANAGFERSTHRTLTTFVEVFARYDRVVALSGSCALHLRLHAGDASRTGERVAEATTEFCAFLHDDIGLAAIEQLGATFPKRIGVHIGCHGLRGLGLAKPSELQGPPFNKVRALLETVQGITFAEITRPDECCGFGGTFAVSEVAISAKMGRDRLRDYARAEADAVVSTDMSCLLHLGGLSRRAGADLPMLHVAEVLASRTAASNTGVRNQ